jgi:hypothetical protein
MYKLERAIKVFVLLRNCATMESMRVLLAVWAIGSFAACGLTLQASQTDSNDAGASSDSTTPVVDSGGGTRDAGVADVTMKTDADPGPPKCDLVANNERTVEAQQGASPVIDGKADDWSGANWHQLKNQAVAGGTTPCADFATRWDADGIYLYARVADPMHLTASPSTFYNDSIEVFLGPSPVDSVGRYGMQERQYSIDYNGAALVRRVDSNDAFEIVPLSSAEIVFAVDATSFSWGYGVEVRILPKAFKPGPTKVYAFDIAAVDGAGAGNPQQGYMAWAPLTPVQNCDGGGTSDRYCCGIGSAPFCNTKYWGTLNLK